ncbi:hypothetical protein [Actinomycetospora callitridis]|uniref:hypothetical protein n=1 Tax=Actinomycetospora callitridis TaxID=913944 RepID=UPI002366D28A|nr:hypothetical protein [Actinomycetospora callitridis]MDD7919886.1 hypothetical protein [Actinomycetospora callitridis]
MHIRTDDDVYRVDAVWLGPPRATFPWRARYSAYGVGLLVMLVVMFVQRRLGIDLGFFSVAWALLITVAVTRFVSRRINDERPLLEWLTLFVHELRGPRARDRVIGGALTTGHVTVRRDRPRLTGAPTAIALPRGSDRSERVIAPEAAEADDSWGPPPRDDEPPRERAARPAAPGATEEPAATAPPASAPPATATAAPEPVPQQRRPASARAGEHLTPGVEDAVPSHRRAARAAHERRTRARRPGRTAAAPDADFGPPSSAAIGAAEDAATPTKAEPTKATPTMATPTMATPTKAEPKKAAPKKAAPKKEAAALPPAADRRAGDASVAAWTGAGRARREAVPAHRRTTAAADADPDRTQRRPTRPRRRPGWPMSNEPSGSSAPDAPFGPGTRGSAGRPESGRGSARGGDRGDNGAAPR